MKKQQLQQEIEALQKQLEEKQKALAAMPDKWEPKGWGYLDRAGLQCECAIRKRAEKTTKAMQSYNRLLAYVAEFAPNFEFDLFDRKWFVTLCHESKIWYADWCSDFAFGMVFMPKEVARELAAKLNSGEVEL